MTKRALAAALAGGVALSAAARAQAQAPQLSAPLQPGDTVLATPFGRYDVGFLHRWVLGSGHRELWSVPVPAPVLDLSSFAGGLTLTGTGGGLQTRSLVFAGGDGQQWRFRSIDKDATRTLDPILRETLAARIVQDQIAHLFPLSATVVERILEAAGILHPEPTLVVLPDDPRLGEQRQDFRGMLGWMEVRPDEGPDGAPGFAGSGRVVASDRMLERLAEEPGTRVDARAYLQARLVDALVGDWDRHPDQWRWAGFAEGGGLTFQPVPRDRDWALSRLDGFMTHFTWIPWPHYVGFRPTYPSAFRLTWSGRALDRQLLSGLDRQAWRDAARALQARITDPVIDEAVARLPATYPPSVGRELAAALRTRRDALDDFADEFYRLLAGWVDVHTADRDEVAEARWLDGGRLVLTVREADARTGDPPSFRRVFHPDETREVRVYLHGGDDVFTVHDGPPSSVKLRVVGGGGDDRLAATHRAGGPAVLYDHRGENRLEAGPRARVDTGAWDDPVDADDNTHRAGHRDWGARTLALPALRFDPDLGLFAGATVARVGYGFRRYPHHTRVAVSVAAASGTGQPDVIMDADLPVPGSRALRADLRARIYGTEFHRFYGFGNDSPADHPAGKDAYDAPRRVLGLDAALRLGSGPGWSASLETSVRGHHPFRQEGTLVEELSPYGSGEFEEVVVGVRVRGDHRDRALSPRRGYLVELGAEMGPPLLDVTSTYGAGTVRGEAHWQAPMGVPLRPGLAFRAGGRWVFGRAPYHAAALIGGPETVRGLRTERLAGDAALWAGLEARGRVAEAVLLLPGELGVLLLGDAGRVFVDGESPGGWHLAWGGGAWMSFLDAYTVTLSAARGPEDTLVYFTLGLPF